MVLTLIVDEIRMVVGGFVVELFCGFIVVIFTFGIELMIGEGWGEE